MHIAEDINDGKIRLPDLDFPDADTRCAVWALVGGGRRVHVLKC